MNGAQKAMTVRRVTKMVGCHGELEALWRRPARQVLETGTHAGVVDEHVQLPFPPRELLHELPNRRRG